MIPTFVITISYSNETSGCVKRNPFESLLLLLLHHRLPCSIPPTTTTMVATALSTPNKPVTSDDGRPSQAQANRRLQLFMELLILLWLVVPVVMAVVVVAVVMVVVRTIYKVFHSTNLQWLVK